MTARFLLHKLRDKVDDSRLLPVVARAGDVPEGLEGGITYGGVSEPNQQLVLLPQRAGFVRNACDPKPSLNLSSVNNLLAIPHRERWLCRLCTSFYQAEHLIRRLPTGRLICVHPLVAPHDGTQQKGKETSNKDTYSSDIP